MELFSTLVGSSKFIEIGWSDPIATGSFHA